MVQNPKMIRIDELESAVMFVKIKRDHYCQIKKFEFVIALAG